MDKIMKVEIEKVMGNLYECALYKLNNIEKKKDVDLATSSLTTLIIKWLEGKKVKIIVDCWENVERDKTRNQLITELIGELK